MSAISPIGDAAANSPMLLTDIFDAVARRYPDRIAIEIPPVPSQPDRIMRTYAQLREHSDTLAACLAPFARADGIIAILLPRDTPDLYAAQLAVLKAGAAFTCIDPNFPDEHLRAVLDDAGAEAIITDGTGRKRLHAVGHMLAAIIDPQDCASINRVNVCRAGPNNLAYVIYTSGTTGKPKGVLIEHH